MERGLNAVSLDTESSEEVDDVEADSDYEDDYMPKMRQKKNNGTARRRSTLPAKKAGGPVKTSNVSTSTGLSKKRGRPSKTPTTSNPKFASPKKSAAKTSTQASSSASSSSSIGNTKSVKNGDFQDAVKVTARLPPCNLGAMELLTFFPFHVRWPAAGLRLWASGWKDLTVGMAQLFARGKLFRLDFDTIYKRRSAMGHTVKKNGQIHFGDDDFKVTTHRHLLDAMPTNYNATTYMQRPKTDGSYPATFDAKLVDLAKGVEEWPNHQDCGILTQAIQWAIKNGGDDLTTADIPWMAETYGFPMPAESQEDGWDQAALKRFKACITVKGLYIKEKDWNDVAEGQPFEFESGFLPSDAEGDEDEQTDEESMTEEESMEDDE